MHRQAFRMRQPGTPTSNHWPCCHLHLQLADAERNLIVVIKSVLQVLTSDAGSSRAAVDREEPALAARSQGQPHCATDATSVPTIRDAVLRADIDHMHSALTTIDGHRGPVRHCEMVPDLIPSLESGLAFEQLRQAE